PICSVLGSRFSELIGGTPRQRGGARRRPSRPPPRGSRRPHTACARGQTGRPRPETRPGTREADTRPSGPPPSAPRNPGSRSPGRRRERRKRGGPGLGPRREPRQPAGSVGYKSRSFRRPPQRAPGLAVTRSAGASDVVSAVGSAPATGDDPVNGERSSLGGRSPGSPHDPPPGLRKLVLRRPLRIKQENPATVAPAE